MRRLLIYLAVGAAALIVVPSGLSSTPTQIYRDYADNGRLDRHYSQSDMNRALKDAVLQGYGNTRADRTGGGQSHVGDDDVGCFLKSPVVIALELVAGLTR